MPTNIPNSSASDLEPNKSTSPQISTKNVDEENNHETETTNNADSDNTLYKDQSDASNSNSPQDNVLGTIPLLKPTDSDSTDKRLEKSDDLSLIQIPNSETESLPSSGI